MPLLAPIPRPVQLFLFWIGLSISFQARGFVLVSGSLEAKLAATTEAPTVTFSWDGESPTLEKAEEFAGGAYQDLEPKDLTRTVLEQAFAIWNEVPSAFIELAVEEQSGAATDSEDGVNVITVSEVDSQSTAAFAAPIVDQSTASIKDCDITISKRKTSVKYLAYTIAHEVGHCLGLGHAHTNYGAMMGYSRDDQSLSLGPDDIAGVTYLYPDPAYVPDAPTEVVCGTIGRISKGSAGTNQHWYLALFMFGLPLAVGRRKLT